NFSFSRWGDGEFFCAFQNYRKPQNCDGHFYFADLGKRLRRILESRPRYYIGTRPRFVEMQMKNPAFRKLYRANEWSDAGIIWREAKDRSLFPFFEALHGRRVILVAN